MEVLLLQDIPGVGKKNDLLSVGDGFALNCLLPQSKALIATPTVRKRYAEQIKRRAEQKIREKELQTGAAAVLGGKTISFKRKITKTGKLYAAITEKHIAEELKKQHGADIKETEILVTEPIKALGSFEVKLKIGESELPLTVKVDEEKAS